MEDISNSLDSSTQMYSIQNHFEGSIETIQVRKCFLLSNFDYFKSMDKYGSQLGSILDLNLTHDSLKLCLNLLEGSMVEETDIELSSITFSSKEEKKNVTSILHVCCALLCNNLRYLSNVIRNGIRSADAYYLLNKNSDLALEFCDQLQSISIYPNIKNILTDRLTVIVDPNVFIERIMSRYNLAKENTIILLVTPQSFWETCPSTQAILFFRNCIWPIGLQPNSRRSIKTSHIKLRCHVVYRNRDMQSNPGLVVDVDTKKSNLFNQNITIVFKKFIASYSDCVAEDIVTNYGTDSFCGNKGRGEFVFDLSDDPLNMFIVCISSR